MPGFAIAVVSILLGVIAVLGGSFPSSSGDDGGADAVAHNFLSYRAAVNHVALYTPQPDGAVSGASLNLPSTWAPVRNWRNQIQGGRCYVWGNASADEIRAAQRGLNDSYSIGTAINGHIVTAHGSGEALPGFIADGSIVSVVEVKMP
jgi:type II secretory pathway pseudopilin PulG